MIGVYDEDGAVPTAPFRVDALGCIGGECGLGTRKNGDREERRQDPNAAPRLAGQRYFEDKAYGYRCHCVTNITESESLRAVARPPHRRKSGFFSRFTPVAILDN